MLFAPECIGDLPKQMIEKMLPGDVIILENVRFHPEEEANDMEFAAQLAELGDIYVNDAFGDVYKRQG